MNPCNPKFDSEVEWRAYLKTATEREVLAAIREVVRLEHAFFGFKKKTKACLRMHKFFDIGVAMYEERFEREWVPF